MRSIAPPAATAPFRIRTILAPLMALILGSLMAILDSTVINVAVPTLERVFKSDLHLMEWSITGYLLAQAAVIPLAGWLSDRFGARRLYIVSIALFTLGSLLCALAPSAGTLVLFRALQGLGGGMLLPIGMSFVYRLVSPEKRGVVMGIFGIPVLVGPTVGPLLAGWLIQYADWRYIFLINVPIGGVAMALALRALPAMPAQRAAGRLDLLGALLAPLGFGALSYGISESTVSGWTGAHTLAGILVGLAALIAFTIRELTCQEPLLELRVFRGRDFSVAIAAQWTMQASLIAGMFLVPLFLQQLDGYSARDTGLAMVPMPLGAALFMVVGGRLFDRVGVRPLVLAGMPMVTVSTWLLAQVTAGTTARDLIMPFAVRGLGMGLMLMSLNTHVINCAPRDLVSRVTSLSTALANVVGSLAIATFGTVLQRRTVAHLGTAGGARHALALGFDDTFMVVAVLTVVGLLLGLALRREPRAAQDTVDEPAPAAELLAG